MQYTNIVNLLIGTMARCWSQTTHCSYGLLNVLTGKTDQSGSQQPKPTQPTCLWRGGVKNKYHEKVWNTFTMQHIQWITT